MSLSTAQDIHFFVAHRSETFFAIRLPRQNTFHGETELRSIFHDRKVSSHQCCDEGTRTAIRTCSTHVLKRHIICCRNEPRQRTATATTVRDVAHSQSYRVNLVSYFAELVHCRRDDWRNVAKSKRPPPKDSRCRPENDQAPYAA
jgi:hypothetical protein